MKNDNTNVSSDVVKVTRDAVIRTAAGVRALQKKTAELAADAKKRWEESKPRQQRAKDQVRKAAQQVVDFGKDVGEGLKEGLADVRKGDKA